MVLRNEQTKKSRLTCWYTVHLIQKTGPKHFTPWNSLTTIDNTLTDRTHPSNSCLENHQWQWYKGCIGKRNQYNEHPLPTFQSIQNHWKVLNCQQCLPFSPPTPILHQLSSLLPKNCRIWSPTHTSHQQPGGPKIQEQTDLIHDPSLLHLHLTLHRQTRRRVRMTPARTKNFIWQSVR